MFSLATVVALDKVLLDKGLLDKVSLETVIETDDLALARSY